MNMPSKGVAALIRGLPMGPSIADGLLCTRPRPFDQLFRIGGADIGERVIASLIGDPVTCARFSWQEV
jgi:hypothetical protein